MIVSSFRAGCRHRAHSIQGPSGLVLVVAICLAGAATSAAGATPKAKPDFGPNVEVFNPSMPAAAIQQKIDKVYAIQRRNEFGPQRNAFFFEPGDYNVDIPVGFYTQVLGLGASPDSVRIKGNVHSDASHDNNNATTTFWRAAEGFSVNPTGGAMQWAVSRLSPSAACTCAATLLSIKRTAGQAADGCPTR